MDHSLSAGIDMVQRHERSPANCYNDGVEVGLMRSDFMCAVEFEAEIRDGVVKIPEHYARLKNGHAKVVVMIEDSFADPDVKALSEHSASTIEEWKDPVENEIWK